MRGPAGARENLGEYQGKHPPAHQGSPPPSAFPIPAAGHAQTCIWVRWGAIAQEDNTRWVRGIGRAVARAPEGTDGGSN
jgi:hypothetical protein